MAFEQLTEKIIGCAIDVHSVLGPGLLENAYRECLFYKLSKTGLYVEKEKPLPLVLKRLNLTVGIELIY